MDEEDYEEDVYDYLGVYLYDIPESKWDQLRDFIDDLGVDYKTN